ncbi:MAG: hypothetical protein K8R58_12945 [Bacteroidales bacterium]|nr:hypothetical protein [Bacteroidales bacterium]
MKNLLFTLVLIFLTGNSIITVAQISQGGIPVSFTDKTISNIIKIYEFQKPDLEKLALEDEENESNGMPYRNAVSIPVNLNIFNSGIWTDLDDGSKIWRLRLKSEDALALSVYYDQFWLPHGGKLYLYNEEQSQVIGAFSEYNNKQTGLFATEFIQGEIVTLEYYQPSNSMGEAIISISEIAYAYRGVSFMYGNGNNGDDFGDSWWCHINVNCSTEGDNWQDEKRGVARILIKIGAGYYWCSGSLINNTNDDGSPYFLTAAHCGEGASTSDLNQWIFYFNFEAPGCPNPPSQPSSNTMTGATFKANDPSSGNSGSDFYLVLLNNSIPLYYNPYYNGWNRSTSPSPNGVSIHHPAGDIKKISTYTSPLQSTTEWNGLPTHWKVTWVYTTNGRGIIEGGSSGSPIFDNNGRIVGDLTGHYTYSSCTTPSPAFYGKFSYSWDQNGSTPSTRLKDWLDPGNTGVIYLDAYDPNATFPPSCTTPVYPTNGEIDVSVYTSLSWNSAADATGYKIYFGTNYPPSNIENGTDLGNVLSYVPTTQLLNNQDYYWKIVPYNTYGEATGCSIWSFTTEAGIPSCPIPDSPYDGEINVAVNTTLNWSSVPETLGYLLYFGTDNPPTNIVYGEDLGTNTTYTPVDLLSYNEVYYWKIIPYNAYGYNVYCDIWQFTTMDDPSITTFPWVENFIIWPPEGFDLTGGTYNWIHYNVPTYSAEAPFLDMPQGYNALMTTPPLNISNLLNPVMMFAWSHLYNPSFPADILEISISNDGGSNWTSVWFKAGPYLNSNDGAGSNYPGSFVIEEINLSGFNNKGTILIYFNGISGLGSDLFIDYIIVYDDQTLPDCAESVSPLDGAINVPINATLNWDTVTQVNGYKIYFGTDNPPTNIENSTDLGNVTTYIPASLNYDEDYYWKIVPYNSVGDATDCSVWSFSTVTEFIQLDIKAYLEGPYNGSDMNTDINTILPTEQPYNTVPWYYTGTESVAAIPNVNVVDWVLVELRETSGDASTATSDSIIAQQAAFILNDGSIVGLDGNGACSIATSITNNLFVVIWQRNHLGIMSAYPLTESGGVYTYDFSTGDGQAYGGANGHKEIGTGVWGMIGGDGDANSQIGNVDKNDVWAVQAGTSGYLSGDFTMDVHVNNSDKNDVWSPNSGKGGQVPDWILNGGFKCMVPK